MSNIQQKLNETAAMSRIQAIESAYAGRPTGGSNFGGKWKGFDENGNGQVEIDGKTYSAPASGSRSIPADTNVLLRVGKNIKRINW